MRKHNLNRQKAEITATDELSAAQCEIEILREQVEFSREQIETLNLDLAYTQQQIQDIEQELRYTNQELCNALRSQKLEHGEAVQLAQKIFKSNKSTSQCLVELLTGIYGCTTKSEELEQLDSLSIRTDLISAETNRIVPRLKEIKAHSKLLHSQYKNFKTQSANLNNTFVEMLEIYTKFKILRRKMKDDYIKYVDNKHYFSNFSK